eukprot:scaffold13345_cov64-Phaeocystis_antarctica.AAC.4
MQARCRAARSRLQARRRVSSTDEQLRLLPPSAARAAFVQRRGVSASLGRAASEALVNNKGTPLLERYTYGPVHHYGYSTARVGLRPLP